MRIVCECFELDRYKVLGDGGDNGGEGDEDEDDGDDLDW